MKDNSDLSDQGDFNNANDGHRHDWQGGRRQQDKRHVVARPADQRQRGGGAGKPSKRSRYTAKSAFSASAEAVERPFTCGHCGRRVPLLPSGGRHRNHCPYCLYSRHVDDLRTGDRANPCGGLMQPIGAFQRPNGEHVIVHRCLTCGFERFNRIAADDDFDLVLALPVVPPRSAQRDPQG